MKIITAMVLVVILCFSISGSVAAPDDKAIADYKSAITTHKEMKFKTEEVVNHITAFLLKEGREKEAKKLSEVTLFIIVEREHSIRQASQQIEKNNIKEVKKCFDIINTTSAILLNLKTINMKIAIGELNELQRKAFEELMKDMKNYI